MSVLAAMIVLPGLVLIINPSIPILFNSSLVTIEDIRDEDELPAINDVDLFTDDKIVYEAPVNPENAFVNSFLIIEMVCELPKTTGESICFLY